MKEFVSKEKMSKKARKELAKKKRTMWTVDPRTRVAESRKVYNRKRISRSDAGDYSFLRLL